MKSIKTVITIVLLSFCHFTSFGQDEIFGKWKVKCFLERNQNGSMSMCDICPTMLESNSLKIFDFTLEINKQNLKISVDGKTAIAAYIWDDSIDQISFEYNSTKYAFKVFRGTTDSSIILKEMSTGGLLLLNRI